ncbi:MAG TPA: thymidylate kinase [Candidatus Eremiobacteraceae bacterium]|nr:thymidylate kinase [Candidatus Eremiobacteraceae bacterium]
MKKLTFYGDAPPNLLNVGEIRGKLIVVEGPDGVGRSTQISELRRWLEGRGSAVIETGFTRSALAGKGIKQAKQGHTLGSITLFLYYATDFGDIVEGQIIPGLRSGYIILADRYIYSAIARGVVRGADPQWIREVYGFAPVPDAVLYLNIGVNGLIERTINSGKGFNYWESGMDLRLGNDMFDSFKEYQARVLNQFEGMVGEYGFQTIDADRPVDEVADDLRSAIDDVLSLA